MVNSKKGWKRTKGGSEKLTMTHEEKTGKIKHSYFDQDKFAGLFIYTRTMTEKQNYRNT